MVDLLMINFFKKNWVWIVIIIVISLAFGTKDRSPRGDYGLTSAGNTEVYEMKASSGDRLMMLPSLGFGRQTPPSEDQNRVIIRDTGLSLQVKDVAESIRKIENITRNIGGFLIHSQLSKPESAANGSISVRVPEEKRAEAMEAFKKEAVKVVSESVNGTDVTDEYTDLQAQLQVLERTKVKFESILNQAVAVKDLLEVQRELLATQRQIDDIKGQQKFYEQSAKLSKITVYLSTDDLALPYSPSNEWRPRVIFKEAVRSLIQTIRSLGSLLIWVIVFLPIIIPVILVVRYLKKRQVKNEPRTVGSKA